MHPDYFVSTAQEKSRYEQHNNDINDPGYQDFVKPIVNGILTDFTKKDCGLDFGCGTGPVITKLLRAQNYTIHTYDPLFNNNRNALERPYNFIACCEVIEHFHNPLKDFQLLKSLLLPHGKLYCMTELYNESIDFEKWYYKNDDTHVIFYHTKTVEWIKENLGFNKVRTKDRLIIFEI
jgi:2-polyprenyl-3-methyl-5-hydroxy-6-metoxy-1,4-benzoquinol methylase